MSKFLSISAALLLFGLPIHADKVRISTPRTAMVFDISKGYEPQFLYYGPSITEADMANLDCPNDENWSRADLYPAYGATHTMSETCLAIRHSDGNLSTNLIVDDYKVTAITDKAPNGKPRKGNLLTIRLKDSIYPVTVHLYYLAYNDVDMIESWTDITNAEKQTITLTQFYNPLLPVRRNDVYCTHFHGSWASEAQLYEQKLQNGLLEIKDKDGLRNATANRNEVMLSLDGPAKENFGDVIGAALCYSGNYRISIDTDDSDYHYYFAGINPDNSEYHLRKGETFTTPRSAYTYSVSGTNGVSQTFHSWARKYMLRHADQERMILLNSWEGVYFDINHEGMDQMMRDIKSMGGELFVMDDGWFGEKYPRLTEVGAWRTRQTWKETTRRF